MNKAAQELGRIGGLKKLKNGGTAPFKEMAKLSWEKPSPKRIAMQIIRAGSSAVISSKRRELSHKKNACELCKKTMKKMHFHHPDYNQPFVCQTICDHCHAAWHRANKPVSVTDENAAKLVAASKMTPTGFRYHVIAEAFGYPRFENANEYYGFSG